MFSSIHLKSFGLSLSCLLLLGSLYQQADAQTQAPRIQWDRTLGGSQADYPRKVIATPDGGGIVGGTSVSSSSGEKSQPSQGFNDYWLVKLAADGTKQWDRSYGSSGQEEMRSMQPTADGGYVLAGWSSGPVSGDKSQPSRGSSDYWIVKVDAAGTKQWDKTFGGSGQDQCFSVTQTRDGGYLLGGYSYSGVSGDKTQDSRGQEDYWIIKLDASGTKQWDQRFGGSDQDDLYALQQTSDGGYLLGGQSKSGASGDRSQASWGTWDFWLVKLDASGAK